MINERRYKENPFRKNRAEQMGESAWKYYVPPSNDLISPKPLIFEGSRGSGKSMFFLCNSWKEKFNESKERSDNFNAIFDEKNFIGFYYKADGRFVTSLSGKNVEDYIWISLFNTYFNIVISKEIFAFLDEAILNQIISTNDIKRLCKRVSQKIGILDDGLEGVTEQFESILNQIEYFTNDPEREIPLRLLSGTLIEDIIIEIKRLDLFKNASFHIFIDEFETFSKQQQIQINTLIKQSKYWLVYDISVKTKGIKTQETISGEIIQEPNDFKFYKPEKDSYPRYKEYNNLLIDICRKRIKEVFSGRNISDGYFEIDFYLKDYGDELELADFQKSNNFNDIKNRIKQIIDNSQYDEFQKSIIYDKLTNCRPSLVRMHLALLLRRGVNIIKPHELFEHCSKQTKQYLDWIHNIEFAAIFLLSKELDIPKKYHSFSVFSMLSSGVIRNFLELCERAFDFAFSNDFSFENPRPLTIEEQTKAANFVSQYKVSEIESYIPNGMTLKRFILSLGKIFYQIQTNSDATFGEVEQNHFHTKTFELKESFPNAWKLLNQAVMHNVLQEEMPTKIKNDEIETADYHINHIYCPYFRISYRRKRKILINANDLNSLLTGNSADVNKTISKFSKVDTLRLEDTPTLFD